MLKILRWSIDEDNTLMIHVSQDPLGMQKQFFRVSTPGQWEWKVLSLAGKPTAPVPERNDEVLRDLVMQHPVLGRICDLWFDL